MEKGFLLWGISFIVGGITAVTCAWIFEGRVLSDMWVVSGVLWGTGLVMCLTEIVYPRANKG
jgi:hypothetical protein